jgi:transposase
VEGTGSYGIGVSRALAAAGLPVIECEQPARKDRRGRGKSDAIDAHLAVLFALRQDADRLPTPRADRAREALRILLSARQEMVTTCTGQINRLRALLLSGDDRDRAASRAAFTDAALSSLARRAPTPGCRPGPGGAPSRNPPRCRRGARREPGATR